MLVGAFSSVRVVHYIVIRVYDLHALMRVALRWRSGHERLRVESIMSRDVFLSRTYHVYNIIQSIRIIIIYVAKSFNIYIYIVCSAVVSTVTTTMTSPPPPPPLLSRSKKTTRNTLARSVIKIQNATSVYYTVHTHTHSHTYIILYKWYRVIRTYLGTIPVQYLLHGVSKCRNRLIIFFYFYSI